MKIQDILRAQYVKRWTIVNTTRDQSLAEHTFNVTMIARAICKEYNICDVNVMKACLAHDLDEILTGDIPTPVKLMAKGKGWDLNAIYERVTSRTLSKDEEWIVKIADSIEASVFLDENGSSDRHTKRVAEFMHSRTVKLAEGAPSRLLGAASVVIKQISRGEYTNA